MIIWLASYPKSGNTWVRSFLNSLLFTKDGNANLQTIKNIYQFPVRSQFGNLIHDQNKIDNLKLLSENWIPIQKKLNEDKKIRFIKTHHALCKVEGNSFTDSDNTHGVIYIVRDPRNVITSIKHHYSKSIFSQEYYLVSVDFHQQILFFSLLKIIYHQLTLIMFSVHHLKELQKQQH